MCACGEVLQQRFLCKIERNAAKVKIKSVSSISPLSPHFKCHGQIQV